VTAPVERPIEREYRNTISDNLRWKRLSPRPDDIVVCTPPKCGTTWMQTIVTTLLFQDGDVPGVVMKMAPWIDARFEPIDDIVARLDAQQHRRVMKTHTNADGIPWHAASSYIVVGRDGRDACMSQLNHMRNMRPEVTAELAKTAPGEGIDVAAFAPPPLDDVHEFFAWWVGSPTWFGHVTSFWAHLDEPNVLFVHYNDMKADLEGEMRRVAAFLDIEVDEPCWADLVERCTFESMKRRSAEIGEFSNFVGGADTFLYKGTNGRWRDVLSEDELATFDRRAKEALPPDAYAWTTFGRAALIR